MWKKLSAILLAFSILAISSISAYAGQTDNVGSTTQPAISTGVQQNSTSTAIKGITPSKGGISNEENTSESAIASKSGITSKSAISNKNESAEKRPDFGSVFAGVLEDGSAVWNEYFNLTITNPEKDKESTYYKSYVLSGNSKYDDVIISIAKYNERTGKYEPMQNTDGESSWEIGEFRLFSKEIILTEGTNKIKMLAYRTSQKEEALKENIQVNCFSITLLKESVAKQVIKKTTDWIEGGIKDGVNNTINLFKPKN